MDFLMRTTQRLTLEIEDLKRENARLKGEKVSNKDHKAMVINLPSRFRK